MNLNENIHVNIVHYSPLVYRKANLKPLESDFPSLNWVTERDIENSSERKYLFENEIRMTSEYEFAAGLRLNSFSQRYSRRNSSLIITALKFAGRFYSRAAKSILGALPPREPLPSNWREVALMHIKAIENGVKSGKPWILVLEDDAIIQENFIDSLQVIEKISSKSNVWVNLNDGRGPNLFKSKSDRQLGFNGFYKVNPPTTRCTVAYLINQSLAIAILDELEVYGIPNWIPIDFMLDGILKKLSTQCFWQDPSCVLQGSSNGNYASNLEQHRNKGSR